MDIKLRILFLSYHFQPDLSAGSFRNTALVRELKHQMPDKSELFIITTWPSRYKSFEVATTDYERKDGITIYRIRVPSHKNGIFDQSRAFLV